MSAASATMPEGWVFLKFQGQWTVHEFYFILTNLAITGFPHTRSDFTITLLGNDKPIAEYLLIQGPDGDLDLYYRGPRHGAPTKGWKEVSK